MGVGGGLCSRFKGLKWIELFMFEKQKKVWRKVGWVDVMSNRQIWLDCVKIRKYFKDFVFVYVVGKLGRQ